MNGSTSAKAEFEQYQTMKKISVHSQPTLISGLRKSPNQSDFKNGSTLDFWKSHDSNY